MTAVFRGQFNPLREHGDHSHWASLPLCELDPARDGKQRRQVARAAAGRAQGPRSSCRSSGTRSLLQGPPPAEARRPARSARCCSRGPARQTRQHPQVRVCASAFPARFRTTRRFPPQQEKHRGEARVETGLGPAEEGRGTNG